MTMTLHASLGSGGGFADPVQSSQSVFRCVMDALARPGSVHTIAEPVHTPSPMMSGTAAIALALFDHDTPIWMDDRFSAEPEIDAWLRFHTGAPLTRDASYASYALIHGGVTLPDFETFALGTPEYPDRSTTLVVQVDSLTEGAELVLNGPGIRGSATLRAGALPSGFPGRMRANRALFPRGVDLLLVCGSELVAMPRSTIVAVKEV